MMRFQGVVKKNCITNGGLKYSVIEIKNSVHLNYSLFIPGENFVPGQPVEVTVSVVDVSKFPSKKKKVEVKKAEEPAEKTA